MMGAAAVKAKRNVRSRKYIIAVLRLARRVERFGEFGMGEEDRLIPARPSKGGRLDVRSDVTDPDRISTDAWSHEAFALEQAYLHTSSRRHWRKTWLCHLVSLAASLCMPEDVGGEAVVSKIWRHLVERNESKWPRA